MLLNKVKSWNFLFFTMHTLKASRMYLSCPFIRYPLRTFFLLPITCKQNMFIISTCIEKRKHISFHLFTSNIMLLHVDFVYEYVVLQHMGFYYYVVVYVRFMYLRKNVGYRDLSYATIKQISHQNHTFIYGSIRFLLFYMVSRVSLSIFFYLVIEMFSGTFTAIVKVLVCAIYSGKCAPDSLT